MNEINFQTQSMFYEGHMILISRQRMNMFNCARLAYHQAFNADLLSPFTAFLLHGHCMLKARFGINARLMKYLRIATQYIILQLCVKCVSCFTFLLCCNNPTKMVRYAYKKH